MMLKPRSDVVVEVRNGRVSVEGRVYEAQHVLIIGASKASLLVEPGVFQVRAYFPGLPSVDIVGGDVVKVYREGARYQVDMFGDSITSVKEEGDSITISGDIVTIKFDMDEESINVSLPRVGRVSTRRLEVSSDASTSINAMILPFLTGVVNIYGRARVRIRKDVESTVIEARGLGTS